MFLECLFVTFLLFIVYCLLHTLQWFALNLGEGFAYPAMVCPDLREGFATPAEVRTESGLSHCTPCISMP